MSPSRRGRPPRITHERIVATARGMDPATLTMRAVASELGVDPSALNYHVAGLTELHSLVATSIISDRLGAVSLPGDASWQAALRLFAARMRDALIATGSPNPILELSPDEPPAAFKIVDEVHARLVGSGFAEADAARLMTAVNMLAFASAREVVVSAGGEHPQRAEARVSLPESARATREIIEAWDPASESQFDFALDLLIAGARQALDSTDRL